MRRLHTHTQARTRPSFNGFLKVGSQQAAQAGRANPNCAGCFPHTQEKARRATGDPTKPMTSWTGGMSLASRCPGRPIRDDTRARFMILTRRRRRELSLGSPSCRDQGTEQVVIAGDDANRARYEIGRFGDARNTQARRYDFADGVTLLLVARAMRVTGQVAGQSAAAASRCACVLEKMQ